MLLTRKIPITPTPAQVQVLWALSENCRLLYNFDLAKRRRQWEIDRKKPHSERAYITFKQQQNAR
jgi:putative transposase